MKPPMKLPLAMPNVSDCSVSECAYNHELRCHARAITVGGGVHAACDTYFRADRHTAETSQIAGVGACKIAHCKHNQDFECNAPAIRVSRHRDHADCVTFAER